MQQLINPFSKATTETECKEIYRELFKAHSSNREAMVTINAQLKEAIEAIKAQPAPQQPAALPTTTTPTQPTKPAPIPAADKLEAAKAIAAKVSTLPGLSVEIAGTWVWVTGDTKQQKDQLRSFSFKYSPKKSAWYWHNGPFFRSKNNLPLEQIRVKYGSTQPENENK